MNDVASSSGKKSQGSCGWSSADDEADTMDQDANDDGDCDDDDEGLSLSLSIV